MGLGVGVVDSGGSGIHAEEMRFVLFHHLVQLLHVDCIVSQNAWCHVADERIFSQRYTVRTRSRCCIVNDASAGLVLNGVEVFQHLVLGFFQLNNCHSILVGCTICHVHDTTQQGGGAHGNC